MFLRELASSSSVCAWIPPTGPACDVLERLIKKESILGDVTAMKILQEEIPILFGYM